MKLVKYSINIEPDPEYRDAKFKVSTDKEMCGKRFKYYSQIQNVRFHKIRFKFRREKVKISSDFTQRSKCIFNN